MTPTPPSPLPFDAIIMTVEEFAAWRGQSVRWVRARLSQMPGAFGESRETKRIHLKTYLEKIIKK